MYKQLAGKPDRGIPSLPDEILEETLCYVPIKPLVRMKCVCKQWCKIISDMRSGSQSYATNKGILCIEHKKGCPAYFLVGHDHGREISNPQRFYCSASDMNPPSSLYFCDSWHSCNGLLHFHSFNKSWITNLMHTQQQPLALPLLPATQAYTSICILGLAVVGSKFCVVALAWPWYKNKILSWVFSSNTWRWTRREIGSSSSLSSCIRLGRSKSNTLFFQGALHCVWGSRNILVYFIKTNIVELINLPDNCPATLFGCLLGKSEGQLQLFDIDGDRTCLSIWTYKGDYSRSKGDNLSGEWLSNSVTLLPLTLTQSSGTNPLCFNEDLQVLYITSRNKDVFSYSLETKRFTKLWSYSDDRTHRRFISYEVNHSAKLTTKEWES